MKNAISNSGALETSPGWALASLALTMVMPSLDTSIANAVLPALAQAFGASFQHVQWIVLAYLISITTTIVSVGRLGDIIGRRRLLLIGIGVFTLASLLCGMAPNLSCLIVARAAQGLGAAIMIALAMATVGDTVPKSKVGAAMGLLGTMSAIGTTLGPSLGGVLIAQFGWRTVFLVNVPLGLVNLVLAWRYLRAGAQSRSAMPIRFDLVGTILLVATLSAYALAMTLGHSSFGRLNATLLLASGLGVAGFILAESRAAAPLVRLTIFRNAALSASLAMSLLVSTVMMSTLVVGPFYLSRALGLDPLGVGLALSTGPFMAALTGWPAGRLVDRFGAQRVTAVGLCGLAAGSVVLSSIPLAFGIVGYVAPLVILTSAYALFQAGNNTAIMSGIAADQRGVVSGMLNLSRNLGLITGASVMGAVFAHATASLDISNAPPAAVAAGMRFTFAVAAGLMTASLAIAIGVRRLSLTRDGVRASQEKTGRP